MSRARAGGLMVVTRPDVLVNGIWAGPGASEERRLLGVEVSSGGTFRTTATVTLPLHKFVGRITNELCQNRYFYWWIKGGVLAKWLPNRELYALER